MDLLAGLLLPEPPDRADRGRHAAAPARPRRAVTQAPGAFLSAGRGRFVVLEGLDGAGTTTQTQSLARRLTALGLTVQATAEPSRGPIGALIRQVLAGRITGDREGFDRGSLALLFAADRLDHAQQEIVPALRAGRWVVSDRYVLSSLAYQALDLPQSYVASINSRAPRPDLTIFLEVPAEVSLRRRRAQTAHRDLFEDLASQRRVAKHYQSALAGLPGVDLGPTEIVDGTAGIADVSEAVEALVMRRFKLQRPKRSR